MPVQPHLQKYFYSLWIEIPQCEIGATRPDLGHVAPRRVADALVTLLLAHVIVHNARDPATMAVALTLAVDQGDADGEPGKRGNQRDTLAQ